MRIPVSLPFRFDPCNRRSRQPLSDALQSLSEALVISVGRILDIDIREINAGYRFIKLGNDYFADIFMYDTLSGGAGYASMAKEVFHEVFTELESLLDHCSCTSSCDKCLRHYGNRINHISLDRFLARDLIQFVKYGQLPPKLDLVSQRNILKPLGKLLTLAGWEVSYDGDAPIKIHNSGESIDIWIYPSLIDPKAIGFNESTTLRGFTPYELNKDLPGVFSELK